MLPFLQLRDDARHRQIKIKIVRAEYFISVTPPVRLSNIYPGKQGSAHTP